MATLADLCRWHIFNTVPEDRLLSYIPAQFTWAQFKARYASSSTSLIVLFGPDPIRLIESNEEATVFYLDSAGNVQKRESVFNYSRVPRCGTISLEHAEYLLGMFPRITHLVLSFDNSELSYDFDYLICLLRRWGQSLVSLSLYVAHGLGHTSGPAKKVQLLTQINSMHSLRQLKIKFKQDFYRFPDIIRGSFELTVLARLEQFEYDFPDTLLLANALESYGQPNQNLRCIRYDVGIPSHVYRLFTHEFASYFERIVICLDNQKNFILRFPQITHRCHNLTHLKVKIHYKIDRVHFVRALVPLKQLISLTVELAIKHMKQLSIGSDRTLSRITSLKILRFVIRNKCPDFVRKYSHFQVPQMQLHNIFPNVQLLCLETQKPKPNFFHIMRMATTNGGNLVLTGPAFDHNPNIISIGMNEPTRLWEPVKAHFICVECIEAGLQPADCHWVTTRALIQTWDHLRRVQIGTGTIFIDDNDADI